MTIRGLLLAARWLSAVAVTVMIAVLAVALLLASDEGQRGDAVIALQARLDAFSAQADDLALTGADAGQLAAFSAEAEVLRMAIMDLDGMTAVRERAAATVNELERLLIAMVGPDGTIAPPAGIAPDQLEALGALADVGQTVDAAVLDLLYASKAVIIDRFWGAAIAIATLGLLILVAGIVLLRWLAVRIVSPIVRMTAVVDRIRDGDLAARAPDTGLRELARLGGHLNDMADGRARVEAEMRETLLREEAATAALCRTKTIGRLGGWYVDFKGDVLTWDRQTCAIFDIAAEDAPTRPEDFFDLVDPRDRDWVANMHIQQVEAGRQVDFQHRIVTPGGIKWIWERAEIIRDAEGAPIALDGTSQDITHLKETELALDDALDAASQRAALLRIAGRTARFGGWRYSVGEDRLEWTPETAMIYELSPDTRPTVRRLLAKCDPSDRDRLERCLTDAVTEGQEFNDVFRQTTSKGRPIWTRITGEVVRDALGNIVELQGACQDITHLIAARSEADRRNAELEGVMLSMQDGFMMLDEVGNVLFLNQRARDLLGLGRKLREGNDLVRRLDRAPRQSVPGQLRHALRGDENCLTLLRDPASGTVIEAAVQMVGARRIILMRDVTAERQAQRRLLLLDAALEEIDDIVVIVEIVTSGGATPVARMVYANEAMKRITGLCLEKLMDRAPRARFPEETETQIATLDLLDRAALNREPATGELFTYATDGTQVWLQVQIFPLFDPDSGRTYIVSIERDITADKAREERAFHTAKMEAIGQLTGGVAHDFNNLLTVILGNADMLYDTIEDADGRRRIEAMIAAAERGARLTDSMLAFSRRTPLRPTHTDVNQLIDQSLSLLRMTVPEDIEIDMTLEADHPVADVDAARLQAAIVNLVLNSRDAIGGNGHIALSTSNLEISERDNQTLPVARPGAFVVITVSDDGKGIDPDVMPKVFEPFFTTKPVGAGSGLGLSTIYGFAKQSGGCVKLYSEPGEGTTVRLFLPCIAGVGQADGTILTEETLPLGQGEYVLVVEDDPALLDYVMRQLAQLNYRATPAPDADAALALLADDARDFALLFTDVVLPGELHGGLLADRARALRPGLKVLFTSGYTRTALDRQGRIGADVRLLSKPYRVADLAKGLHDAISG